jgi:hypothetical protein
MKDVYFTEDRAEFVRQKKKEEGYIFYLDEERKLRYRDKTMKICRSCNEQRVNWGQRIRDVESGEMTRFGMSLREKREEEGRELRHGIG